MQHRENSKLIKIEIKPGQEVIATVTQQLADKGIQEAAIVSLVGAVDSCVISTMPKVDAKKDILTEYHEPLVCTYICVKSH